MKEQYIRRESLKESFRALSKRVIASKGEPIEVQKPARTTIEKELPPLVRSGVELIDMYVTYPMIQDTFSEHTERRRWRHSLSEREQGVVDTNALRKNNIGAAINGIDLIMQESGYKKLFKEERDEMYEELIAGWACDEEHPDGLYTTEEKIEYVENRLTPFLMRVRETVVNT